MTDSDCRRVRGENSAVYNVLRIGLEQATATAAAYRKELAELEETLADRRRQLAVWEADVTQFTEALQREEDA